MHCIGDFYIVPVAIGYQLPTRALMLYYCVNTVVRPNSKRGFLKQLHMLKDLECYKNISPVIVE